MQLKIPAYVIKYDSLLFTRLKKIKALWAFKSESHVRDHIDQTIKYTCMRQKCDKIVVIVC